MEKTVKTATKLLAFTTVVEIKSLHRQRIPAQNNSLGFRGRNTPEPVVSKVPIRHNRYRVAPFYSVWDLTVARTRSVKDLRWF